MNKWLLSLYSQGLRTLLLFNCYSGIILYSYFKYTVTVYQMVLFPFFIKKKFFSVISYF